MARYRYCDFYISVQNALRIGSQQHPAEAKMPLPDAVLIKTAKHSSLHPPDNASQSGRSPTSRDTARPILFLLNSGDVCDAPALRQGNIPSISVMLCTFAMDEVLSLSKKTAKKPIALSLSDSPI